MDCTQLDFILAVGRVSVLVLGMFAGTLIVYWGWALYRDAVKSNTSGEVSYKSVKVALTATGPGVFLALFGSYLIYSIVSLKADFGVTERVPINGTKSSSQIAPVSPGRGYMFIGSDVQLPAVAPNPTSASGKTICPPIPACAVRIRKPVLHFGDDSLNPDDIAATLDIAITATTAQMQKTTNAELSERYSNAIITLTRLREGVVR